MGLGREQFNNSERTEEEDGSFIDMDDRGPGDSEDTEGDSDSDESEGNPIAER